MVVEEVAGYVGVEAWGDGVEKGLVRSMLVSLYGEKDEVKEKKGNSPCPCWR